MCARYDKEWIASLLDVEDRLGDTTPERCLRDAGVTAGQTVVDYGCGPGLFTFPAAEIVGAEGKVYAVDIEPRMTTLIAGRAAELGSQNVTALLNEGRRAAAIGDCRLPDPWPRCCTTPTRRTREWRWRGTSPGSSGPMATPWS